MKKKIIFLMILLTVFFVNIDIIKADNLGNAFGDNLSKTAGSTGAGYNTDVLYPDSIITTIIETALSFLGVIFLILMIYGGFLWMTAQGNDDQVKKSQNIIKAAVIGLIIVVSAYAVSWFVIKKMSEATLKSTTTTVTQ